jgi:hypothetical protein
MWIILWITLSAAALLAVIAANRGLDSRAAFRRAQRDDMAWRRLSMAVARAREDFR